MTEQAVVCRQNSFGAVKASASCTRQPCRLLPQGPEPSSHDPRAARRLLNSRDTIRACRELQWEATNPCRPCNTHHKGFACRGSDRCGKHRPPLQGVIRPRNNNPSPTLVLGDRPRELRAHRPPPGRQHVGLCSNHKRKQIRPPKERVRRNRDRPKKFARVIARGIVRRAHWLA